MSLSAMPRGGRKPAPDEELRDEGKDPGWIDRYVLGHQEDGDRANLTSFVPRLSMGHGRRSWHETDRVIREAVAGPVLASIGRHCGIGLFAAPR